MSSPDFGGVMAARPLDAVSPKESQRFVRVYLAVALLVVAAVAALNLTVNPRAYYPTHLVRPLVWTDTGVKIRLMRAAPPPGAVILGSSRAMSLPPATVRQLTGLAAFNAAKSHATPRDCLAMLRFALDDLGWKPREVVLGIDLHALCQPAPGFTESLSFPEVARHMPPETRLLRLKFVLPNLVSMEQAKDSAHSLLLLRRGVQPAANDTYDTDGMLHYRQEAERVEEHRKSPATLLGDLDRFVGTYGAPDAPDPGEMRAIREIVELAARRGTRVRAFLTTDHSALLARLVQTPGYQEHRAELVRFVAGLERPYPNLSFIDLTDPSRFGADPAAFNDLAHPVPPNTDRMLRRIFGAPDPPTGDAVQ